MNILDVHFDRVPVVRRRVLPVGGSPEAFGVLFGRVAVVRRRPLPVGGGPEVFVAGPGEQL